MQDASGVQTFSYGNMGELIENIHTFVVPNGNPYTFKMQWAYDSWNRIDSIYYPYGEEVNYDYNNAGQLISLDGTKGQNTFNYVDSIRYDKFGSRARIRYGNGTASKYTYDAQSRRLTNLKIGDAKSKIWTHIASKMEGQQIYDETFSMSDLTGGKIYFDATINGNWESSYALGKGKGKISGSNKYSYETTVENIQSSIGVHEYYSHIKKNQGDRYSSHRLAYKNVINYKTLWNKITDAYKGFNMRALLEYTKSEPVRTRVDPLYRNLYKKYKDKR